MSITGNRSNFFLADGGASGFALDHYLRAYDTPPRGSNRSETALVYATSSETALFPHRPLLFFAINMGFITTLTGVQFFLKPEPSVSSLSWIDLSFLCYGVFFILFSFLYPEKEP